MQLMKSVLYGGPKDVQVAKSSAEGCGDGIGQSVCSVNKLKRVKDRRKASFDREGNWLL